jgi:hypothetical protein
VLAECAQQIKDTIRAFVDKDGIEVGHVVCASTSP